MNKLFGSLLLACMVLTIGCGKSDLIPNPEAAAPDPAPATTESAAAPNVPAPTEATETADASAAKPAPTDSTPPADPASPEEAKPTTDARPTVLLKLLAKPLNDAVQEATKALPLPKMGSGNK